jgi:hypothetical protein
MCTRDQESVFLVQGRTRDEDLEDSQQPLSFVSQVTGNQITGLNTGLCHFAAMLLLQQQEPRQSDASLTAL